MPEEFDPENLERPQPQVPGGPAIKLRDPSAVQNTTDKAKQQLTGAASKLVGEAGAALATSAGLGALAGVAKKVGEWATEKLLNKGYWKAILIPAVLPSVIILAIMTVTLVPAFARIGSSRRGIDGKTLAADASVLSAADMASIQEVLGNSNSLNGDPTKWYFNQGDPRWGSSPGQTGGWTKNSYAARACAITSAAMIAKYYGIQDITPYVFGGILADTNNNMALDKDVWVNYVNKRGLNKTLVSVPLNLDSVKKEIAAGNPILAQGVRAFRASGQHWVVIIGVSKDDKFIVINDPSSAESRGRPARYSPANELGSGLVKGLWTLHDN